MSPHTRRILAVVALLAAANVVCYGLRSTLAARDAAVPPFPDLPNAVGPWLGAPVPIQDEIYDYLKPDHLSSKVYRHGKEEIRAAAIYSRDWRSVHSPAMCFTSAGWSLLQQRSGSIAVPAGGRRRRGRIGAARVPVQELVAVAEKRHIAALYTFLTPDDATDSWLRQCWRMAVSGRGRGGVLLLLSADVRHSPERTRELLGGLLGELYVTFAETWQSREDG